MDSLDFLFLLTGSTSMVMFNNPGKSVKSCKLIKIFYSLLKIKCSELVFRIFLLNGKNWSDENCRSYNCVQKTFKYFFLRSTISGMSWFRKLEKLYFAKYAHISARGFPSRRTKQSIMNKGLIDWKMVLLVLIKVEWNKILKS